VNISRETTSNQMKSTLVASGDIVGRNLGSVFNSPSGWISVSKCFSAFHYAAYVADWKVQLDVGEPHEVKDHSVEVSQGNRGSLYHFHGSDSVFVLHVLEFFEATSRNNQLSRRIC
jgi:hypothetical protein